MQNLAKVRKRARDVQGGVEARYHVFFQPLDVIVFAYYDDARKLTFGNISQVADNVHLEVVTLSVPFRPGCRFAHVHLVFVVRDDIPFPGLKSVQGLKRLLSGQRPMP